MMELLLIVLGGLLGSAHCVGMCGGFALSIGIGARSVSENVRRQGLYSLGRIFTYSFFGLIAGYAGLWLSRRAIVLMNLQAVLCVAAGLFLGVQGLLALGVVPWRSSPRVGGAPCLAGSFVGPFLASPHAHNVFLAGVLTGFLPCGLVYGYLALATSTASLTKGLLTMACFGLGTAPLMILTGVGASFATLATRRSLLRVAAWCVLLTGLISLARGIWFVQSQSTPHCPGCLFY